MIGKRRKLVQSANPGSNIHLREPGKPLPKYIADELGVSQEPFAPKAIGTFTVKDRRERESRYGLFSRKKTRKIFGKPRNTPDVKSITKGLILRKKRK